MSGERVGGEGGRKGERERERRERCENRDAWRWRGCRNDGQKNQDTPLSPAGSQQGGKKHWLLGVEAPLLRPLGHNWLKPAGTGHPRDSSASQRVQLSNPAHQTAAGGHHPGEGANPKAMLQAPVCAREEAERCVLRREPPRPAHAAHTPGSPPPQFTPAPSPSAPLGAAP